MKESRPQPLTIADAFRIMRDSGQSFTVSNFCDEYGFTKDAVRKTLNNYLIQEEVFVDSGQDGNQIYTFSPEALIIGGNQDQNKAASPSSQDIPKNPITIIPKRVHGDYRLGEI